MTTTESDAVLADVLAERQAEAEQDAAETNTNTTGSVKSAPTPTKTAACLGISRASGAEQTTFGPPPPPDDLGVRGRALWVSMQAVREFEEPHTSLLHEFARIADRLESLDADVKENGTSLPWGTGVRANPALIESRQQQLVFNRLAAALEVTEQEEKPQSTASERMQRRRGNR